jgi:threonine dehydratase
MVTILDIQKAADRIKGLAQRTPVLSSRSFDAEVHASVRFKCENLQKGGAFKIRGAANFIFSLGPEELAKGVVTHSSGNHAQAVAIAARAVGAQATVVMPEDAPQAKLAATAAYGAKIVRYDRFQQKREELSAAIAAETGATLVPPFDHEWIVAGQGTVALELLEQEPNLDALVVCLGGGGLLAGCATAAKAINPGIRVFGVEPEDGNDYFLSLRAGERVEIPPPRTIADGLRTQKPGAVNFPIIREHVDQVLLVSDEEIKAALRFLLFRLKILVEPSGAVGAAAVLFRKLPPGLTRVGVVLSGGNVDPEPLASYLT